MLLRVKDYQTLQREWWAAQAFVLPVLPRELIFVHQDIFRFLRNEVLAWLVNIGHRLADDLLLELPQQSGNADSPRGVNGEQLPIEAARDDQVARPILEKAVTLEAVVELDEPKSVLVRYVSRG